MKQNTVCVQIGDGTIFQKLNEEIVLLNMSNNQYYGLDDVGADMWRVLLETGSTAAAADQLSTLYDVDRLQMEADLNDLVDRLVHAGLLKVTKTDKVTVDEL
jgi:hypothetical protein